MYFRIILLFLILIPVSCSQQSHLLSQITSIDINLNMRNFSIINVSWLNTSNINTSLLCLNNNCYNYLQTQTGWIISDNYLFNNTTNVKVGIGTSTPSLELHVNGSILATNNLYAKQLLINDGFPNGLTIDSSGNILTRGNLTFSGYTYIIDVLRYNGTLEAPYGIKGGYFYPGICNTGINCIQTTRYIYDTGSATRISSNTEIGGSLTVGNGLTVSSGTVSLPANQIDSSEVNFNYAGSSSKGGPATDLACTDCVALGTETTGNYVANVSAGSGISVTGADGEGVTKTVSVNYDSYFTTSGSSLSLANSGVVAGTYGSSDKVPMITVDQKGRITSASNITLTEKDPKVGDVTNTYVCYGNGSAVKCADSSFVWDSSNDILTIGQINTGIGNTEVYLMDQNIRSIDSPTFAGLTLNGNLNMNNYNFLGIGNLYGYSTLSYYPVGYSTNPAHIFYSGNGSSWLNRFSIGGNANIVDVSINNANFVVNSNQLYVKNSDGSVGIGTSNPTHRLELSTHTTASGGIAFGNDVELYRSSANILSLASGDSLNLVSGNLQIGGLSVITSDRNLQNINQFNAGGPMNIDTGTLYVDSTNDRVGIGTTSPVKKLDVVGELNITGDLIVLSGNIKQNGTDDLRLWAGKGNDIWFYRHDGVPAGRINVSDVGGSENLDQNQSLENSGDTYTVYYGTSTQNTWKSQSFTPSVSGGLSRIIFKLARVGTYTYNVWVEIQSCSSDTPTGIVLGTSDFVSSSSISSSYTEISFNFSQKVYLKKGQKYCAVIKAGPPSDGTEYIRVRVYTTNNYNGGQICNTQNSGQSWDCASYTSVDTYFKEYYQNYYGVLHIGGVDTSGADLAEKYHSTQKLDQGDIVSLDPLNPRYVIKSTKNYDSTVLGVVSKNPGLVMGSSDDENTYPIALVGRVLAKFTRENGDVEVGDFITTSSIPGYSMKATKQGPIIGRALESSKSCLDKECMILVFVNFGWYDPIYNYTSILDKITNKLNENDHDFENSLKNKNYQIFSNSSFGTAKIPVGYNEIIIKTPFVRDNSLIFITPTSSTDNKVLYVKEKVGSSCKSKYFESLQTCSGWFKVGFDDSVQKETSFNWLILDEI